MDLDPSRRMRRALTLLIVGMMLLCAGIIAAWTAPRGLNELPASTPTVRAPGPETVDLRSGEHTLLWNSTTVYDRDRAGCQDLTCRAEQVSVTDPNGHPVAIDPGGRDPVSGDWYFSKLNGATYYEVGTFTAERDGSYRIEIEADTGVIAVAADERWTPTDLRWLATGLAILVGGIVAFVGAISTFIAVARRSPSPRSRTSI